MRTILNYWPYIVDLRDEEMKDGNYGNMLAIQIRVRKALNGVSGQHSPEQLRMV